MARYFALFPCHILSGKNVRRAGTDFVTCPMFQYVAWTGHRLVRVNLRLTNRPSLAATGSSIHTYWRYRTSGTG